MDVAVVVVRARGRECELIGVASAQRRASKRWKTAVRCRVCGYRVWRCSAVLPDNCWSIYRCIKGGWAKVTCGIGWARAAGAVILKKYVRRSLSRVLRKNVCCNSNDDQYYDDNCNEFPSVRLRCWWLSRLWCGLHFFFLKRGARAVFGIKVVSNIYIPIIVDDVWDRNRLNMGADTRSLKLQRI